MELQQKLKPPQPHVSTAVHTSKTAWSRRRASWQFQNRKISAIQLRSSSSCLQPWKHARSNERRWRKFAVWHWDTNRNKSLKNFTKQIAFFKISVAKQWGGECFIIGMIFFQEGICFLNIMQVKNSPEVTSLYVEMGKGGTLSAYDSSRFALQNIRLHTGTRANVVLLTYLFIIWQPNFCLYYSSTK